MGGGVGTDIGTVTVTDSGGTTFGQSTSERGDVVSWPTPTGTIAFNGAVTATTLSTANQGYNLQFNTAAITGAGDITRTRGR